MRALRAIAPIFASTMSLVAACAEPMMPSVDASMSDAPVESDAPTAIDATGAVDATAAVDASSDAGPPPPDWIVAGGTGTCASREGHVWCWGLSWTEVASTPVEIPELARARTVALGHGHACAILGDGRVACAGDNRTGQLGVPSSEVARREVFEVVEGAPRATAIAVSPMGLSSCAIDEDAAVWCWGDNALGQTGSPIPRHATGGNAPQPTPERVEGLEDARALALGQYHACALRADGHVACWGYDWFAALGRGAGYTGIAQSVPGELEGVSDAVSVSIDGNGGCVLRASGEVSCWGGLVYEYPGFDAATDDECAVVVTQVCWRAPRPIDVASADALMLGGNVGCSAHEGVWSCFGRTIAYGISADGAAEGSQLALGLGHLCALEPEGTIRCRGRGDFGELGDGRLTHSTDWVTVTLE